ncbi:MAG: transcription elongation factor GreA [Bacteroidetes bacterium]|jgi:transcription elongation factor GreA|nr:transcription elongation factor GreA [Bacteroidota bacterium]
MTEKTYVTREGFEKMQEELKFLKSVERPRLSNAIAEAREKGDLSENAEYDAAKDEQGHLEAQIAKLEAIIGNSRILDESAIDTSKVTALCKVTVKNHKINKEVTYQLVSEKEANLKEGKISIASPIGKGLLGKVVGDVVDIQVPAGNIKLEVLNIGI